MTTGQDVATRESGGAIAKPTNVNDVFRSESFKAGLAEILPKHIPVGVLLKCAFKEVRQNSQLGECTPESFMASLMDAGSLGLLPGVLGEGYLIPRYNKTTRRKECQFQPGYQGIAQLAFRSDQVAEAYAYAVYKDDAFDFALGDDAHIKHIPNMDIGPSEANITHFYGVVKLVNGGVLREVMTRKQVDAVRDRYAQKDNEGRIPKWSTWVTDYTAMGRKTALLRALKLAPKSTELARAIEASMEADGLIGCASAQAVSTASGVARDRVASRLGLDEDETPEGDIIDVDDNGEVVDPDQITDAEREILDMPEPEWMAEEAEPKPATNGGTSAAITKPQLGKLGALCKELEELGVPEEKWRADMEHMTKGKRSRKELTKAQATKLIERWQSSIEDQRAKLAEEDAA